MDATTRPPTATERAMHRAALEEERRQRAVTLAAKREAGTIRSASANRKRRKHGRR